MKTFYTSAYSVACFFLACTSAIDGRLPFGSGGRTIHHVRREANERANSVKTNNIDPSELYPVRHIDLPINHFPNSSRYEPDKSGTFKNRYWFDASHYSPGGPVIVLQSGETDATSRLVYMQKGILAQLAEATNGIGVVLEHRYYGESFPTDSLSTENLRFLTTEQALADEVYFAQNIVFPGLEDKNLTSHTTAYLSYGGSYPGSISAFLRVKYPEVFWGSISSAGVTKAILDYWHYYATPAEYGPTFCMTTQKLFTKMADNILMGKNKSTSIHKLKHLFGLDNITNDKDFANQLSSGVGSWQALNWDPEVSHNNFYEFCANLSSLVVLFPETESKRTLAEEVIEDGGYVPDPLLVNQLLNYVGWMNLTSVSVCQDEGHAQDHCFSNLNSTFYQQHELKDYVWRSWAYQYCTEWGYLPTGSGVPEDQMSLISRTLDLDYLSTVCREAFNITDPPAVEEVNKFGGYDIHYPRLAIIDGEWDPWRPATPHAFAYGASPRNSTTSEPFMMISRGLHHEDENSLFANETTPKLPPPRIVSVQAEERRFVKAWMEEWKQDCRAKGDCSEAASPPLLVVQ